MKVNKEHYIVYSRKIIILLCLLLYMLCNDDIYLGFDARNNKVSDQPVHSYTISIFCLVSVAMQTSLSLTLSVTSVG